MTFNKQIENNLAELKQLHLKKDVVGILLVELETNRLIQEQNYQELSTLIVNNNKYLVKITKILEKLSKEEVIPVVKQTIWTKIKAIFN